jgi:hypothetical protein
MNSQFLRISILSVIATWRLHRLVPMESTTNPPCWYMSTNSARWATGLQPLSPRQDTGVVARGARAWCPVLGQWMSVVDRRCTLPGTISDSSSTTAVGGRELDVGNHGPWCLKCRRQRQSWIGPGSHVLVAAPRLDRPRALVSAAARWVGGGATANPWWPPTELASRHKSFLSSSSSANKR